jgi:hypothetical protein
MELAATDLRQIGNTVQLSNTVRLGNTVQLGNTVRRAPVISTGSSFAPWPFWAAVFN